MTWNFEPEELSPLERRLRNRPSPGPSVALRSRVLHAVSIELQKSPATRRTDGGFLHFAAAMAALLLIGFNLSLTICSAPSKSHANAAPRQVLATAANLRELSPDLSDTDARRMAALLEMGGGLSPLPAPQARP